MTSFYDWEDVKSELFDEEEIATIEEGAVRRLAALGVSGRVAGGDATGPDPPLLVAMCSLA